MQSENPAIEQSNNDSGHNRLPSYARPTIASLSTLMKRSFKVSKPSLRQVSRTTSYPSGPRHPSKRVRPVPGHSPTMKQSVSDPRRSLSMSVKARTSLLESMGVKPYNDEASVHRKSQEQIANLEAEVARLVQDRHHLLAKIRQENDDSSMHALLEQSQNRVRELEDFQQLTLSRSAEFQQISQDIQEEKRSFEEVTSDLRGQLDAIKSRHKERIAALNQELDAANYKANALQNVVIEHQSQIDGHKIIDEQLEQLRAELAETSAAHVTELERCRDLKSELSKSNNQLNAAQQKISSLEAQVRDCRIKILDLESSFLAAQATVASLHQNSSSDIEEMKTKLNNALSVASSAEEMIATLIGEKEQFHRDSLDAQTLLTVANEKIASLDRERAQMIEDAAVAKANADAAASQAQELKDLTKLYEQTIASLRAAVDTGRALDKQASQTIKELEAHVADERKIARDHVQYLHQYNDAMHKLSETEKKLKTMTENHEAQLLAARADVQSQVSLARAEAQSQIAAAQDAADLKLQQVRQAAQDDFWLAQDTAKTGEADEAKNSPNDRSVALPKHLGGPPACAALLKDVVSMTNVPRLVSPDIFSDHNSEMDGDESASPSRTPSADKTPKHILATSKVENYKLMVSSMTKEKKHKKKSPNKSPNKIHKPKSLLRVA